MSRPAHPATAGERIVALDALRGFALLGILLMNIQSYAMPAAAYLNPTAYGSLEGVEGWVWAASHVFADRKFLTLFSMLFGAGILLFSERAEARTGASRGLHTRRMLWLLVFGALHAHLLWHGDILFSYAVCGLLVYPLRKLPPRRLALIGLGAFAVGTAISLARGWDLASWPPEQVAALRAEAWNPPPDDLAWELEVYRGGWIGQMEHRVPEAWFIETEYLLTYELWRAGGLMLLGMALLRWGVLTGRRSAAFHRRAILAGLVLGLPAILHGLRRHVEAGWDVRYSLYVGPQWNSWASLPMSLAYVGAVVLACRTPAASWLTRPLAAVGRMAFTNYVLQSILCTTLFYGHGAGLFGRVTRLGQLGIVVAIWALQLLISGAWMRRFRMGPLEWLWRSLTYGSRQPLRREMTTHPPVR